MTATATPTMQNFLAENRATLSIHKIKGMEFGLQQFNIPSMSIQVASYSTPFSHLKFTGDHIIYGDVDARFLIDEKMENYMLVQNWIRGIGFPEKNSEFVDQKAEFLESDGTIFVYTNHQNPFMKIDLINMIPLSLSSIDFNMQMIETTQLTANVTFAVERFNVTRLS